MSYVGVPLRVKDSVLGVLGFYTKEEREFTGDEVEFVMTLAGQAAIAIHKSPPAAGANGVNAPPAPIRVGRF